jgi:hypothetical protein
MWILRAYEKGSDYWSFLQGSSEEVFSYNPSEGQAVRIQTIRDTMKEQVLKAHKHELLKKFEALEKKIDHFEIYIHGVREADNWESVRGSYIIPAQEQQTSMNHL